MGRFCDSLADGLADLLRLRGHVHTALDLFPDRILDPTARIHHPVLDTGVPIGVDAAHGHAFAPGLHHSTPKPSVAQALAP